MSRCTHDTRAHFPRYGMYWFPGEVAQYLQRPTPVSPTSCSTRRESSTQCRTQCSNEQNRSATQRNYVPHEPFTRIARLPITPVMRQSFVQLLFVHSFDLPFLEDFATPLEAHVAKTVTQHVMSREASHRCRNPQHNSVNAQKCKTQIPDKCLVYHGEQN